MISSHFLPVSVAFVPYFSPQFLAEGGTPFYPNLLNSLADVIFVSGL